MNKPLSQHQRDAMKAEHEATQFERFQGRYKELCEYTLAKPDELIYLSHFKKEIECGTACCIAGNLVELWPKEYEWIEIGDLGSQGPSFIKNKIFRGTDAIYALMDASQNDLDAYPDLDELFFANLSKLTGPISDREVIEERMELVAKCSSFEQLNESLFSGSYYK